MDFQLQSLQGHDRKTLWADMKGAWPHLDVPRPLLKHCVVFG